MDPTLQLIVEQLSKLSAGQEKMSADLKTDISAVSPGQDELKTDISAVSGELKTGIIAVEVKIGAVQEQIKNDIQDEISSIKES
jgi:hypothetical protein